MQGLAVQGSAENKITVDSKVEAAIGVPKARQIVLGSLGFGSWGLIQQRELKEETEKAKKAKETVRTNILALQSEIKAKRETKAN